MGITTDPNDPNKHLIDCRPDGYKGRRVREIFIGTLQAAEDYYRAIMRQPTSKPQLPKALTCKSLWPRYLRFCTAERAASTIADLKVCWHAHLADFFGHLQPKNINKELIQLYKNKRLAERKWGKSNLGAPKHRTINKELSYLSGFLTWAAENDLCDPLPFRIAKFPRKLTRAPIARPLPPDEITKILEAIEPQYKLVFLLMADAGLRVSEALTLKREQVDIGSRIIYIVGKGNKERIVPVLTDRLMDELKKRESSGGYLTVSTKTGRPYTRIRKALLRATAKAGVEKHVYQHLLRHSFGTTATMAGLPPATVQDIMGHSDPETTKIYINFAEKQLFELGARFKKIVEEDVAHMDDMGK